MQIYQQVGQTISGVQERSFLIPQEKFQRLLSPIRSKCLLTNFSIFLDETKATACSSTHNRSTLARSFPRRSKDAGRGSIGLAAVGLGILAWSLAPCVAFFCNASKQWSVQDFSQDTFGPCSALRHQQCSRKRERA